METSDAEEPPVVGCQANRTNYKSDHIEMFDSAGIEWPVKQTAMPWCQHLTQRAFEPTYFGHTHLPFDHEAGTQPEFIAVNLSAKRALHKGAEFKNSWKNRLPTLTSHGMYIMRQARPSNSQSREPAQDVASVLGKVHPKLDVSLRQVKGVELLAAIGLDARWIPECARPSRKLSTDMAGNAFSGFCALPVLTALLATVTLTASLSQRNFHSR